MMKFKDVNWYKDLIIWLIVFFIIAVGVFYVKVLRDTKSAAPIEVSAVQESTNLPLEQKNDVVPAKQAKPPVVEAAVPIQSTPPAQAKTPVAPKKAAKIQDAVSFNTRSLKYHKASCKWAKQCTHCIIISRADAKLRGGVPCKVCSKTK